MSRYTQFRKGKKMGPKGFYVALGVCMVAIGAAAWATYDSAMNYTGITSTASSQPALQTEKNVSGLTAGPLLPQESAPAVSQPPVSSAAPAPAPVESKPPAKATNARPAPAAYLWPAGKTPGQAFSENPVYNKTLQDWRAHIGVDFDVDAGATAQAIAGGTVKEINADERYGQTVVIEHGNLLAYYCGLEKPAVKKGDTVKPGAVLGTISAVPCESAAPLHLHFMAKRGGKWIDPMTLFK